MTPPERRTEETSATRAGDAPPGRDGRPRADRSTPQGGGTPPRPPRWRRARPLVLTLLGLALLLGSGALVVAYELSPVSATPTPVTFEVASGWGARRVAQALQDAGLVRNGVLFSLYLRARGLDRSIGEGLYDLTPAMTAPELAAALERGGRPRTVTVVIPEGWRADAIAARLEAAGLGPAAEYRSLVAQPGDLRPDFVAPEDGLEGYLFPAAYELPLHATAREVLGRMLERFARELDASTRDALRARGLSVHAWVTLASMVQAEAASAGEMPVIAGVFLNRLDRGMPLQSDPTVAYGLGKDLPELSVGAGDLKRDTPWNTYTRAGLPRGPIGNPGDAALRAVLEPVRRAPDGQPYLYFLHGSDGGVPVFRPNTSLAGHNRDVQRYLRNAGP